jgi:hypothetical protein
LDVITGIYRLHANNASPENISNGRREKCAKILKTDLKKKFPGVFQPSTGSNTGPKSKFQYGIVIPVYNRPELLDRTLESFLQIYTIHDAKIVIVDDASSDPVVKYLINKFAESMRKIGFNNHVEIIIHKQNYGIGKYYQTLLDGIEKLEDCEYKILGCADAVFNKYLFMVWDEVCSLLGKENKCLSVWNDNRKAYGVMNPVNKHFHIARAVDGMFCMFKDFDIKAQLRKANNYKRSGEDTGVWTSINEALAHGIIELSESLIEHTGNNNSALKPDVMYGENQSFRKMRPIFASNLNLTNMPAVLADKEQNP